jgi:hypothetical protein
VVSQSPVSAAETPLATYPSRGNQPMRSIGLLLPVTRLPSRLHGLNCPPNGRQGPKVGQVCWTSASPCACSDVFSLTLSPTEPRMPFAVCLPFIH